MNDSARPGIFQGLRRAGALALVLAALLPAAAPAVAEPLLGMDEELGQVRGWDIGINTAAGSCIAKARYEDRTTVWFGFGDNGKGFFALSNPRWRSIDEGKSYELSLLARGAGRWRGTFNGGSVGDERSLLATSLKESFMLDIARAGGIEVRYQDKTIARLSLSGSLAALNAVLDCQKDLIARGDGGQRPPAAASKGGDGKGKDGDGGSSSGTAFFISPAGHLLTNYHVVDGCKTVQITRAGSVPEPVQVIARDSVNDLALLKAGGAPPASVPALASRARIGDSIYVYGFPLAGLLASSGNFTVGNVTAVSGLNDDSRMFQISAPVQPGNSGGPLMDQFGNVAGVVVSKLNALRLAAVTKDLAQNVNFAIKASVATTFLDGNSVPPPPAPATAPLDAAAIAERAKAFTVYVECR
ncbi:serine protease [Xanthobacter sp. V3C-3]|uniref:S1C family serine protease n=1 Tax=Xanthobacter lutulentifluminis TaxID=3119935 RepID=UPI0037277544